MSSVVYNFLQMLMNVNEIRVTKTGFALTLREATLVLVRMGTWEMAIETAMAALPRTLSFLSSNFH